MQLPILIEGFQYIILMNIINRIKFVHLIPKNTIHSFSTAKEKVKDIRRSRAQPKTEIYSLSSQQLFQLSSINHYTASVQYLQKNDLTESKKKLQFALNEAMSRFPQSVNLQMCILNRISILQKLKANNLQFVEKLQQIFFMCYSLKGQKSLDSLKHFQNYLTALILFCPERSMAVVEFLREEKSKILLKKANWLIGIAEFCCGEQDAGIYRLKNAQDQNFGQKAMKMNNLGWMKILQASDYGLDFCTKQKLPIVEEALRDLISALVSAQKGGDLDADEKQINNNFQMLQNLEKFLQKTDGNSEILKKIAVETLLMNSQSHIISMNIAHGFFLLNRYEQAILFMKIGLENAIKLQEPDRLGMGLVLMAKINHRLKMPWQSILLDMLKNKDLYSLAVLRQTLQTYSRFLFAEHRYYEAQSYINQSEKINGNIVAEGLYLQEFDFSF